MGKDRPVHILVADDDARVRWALQTLLTQEPDPVTIRESSDVGSLTVEMKDFEPDVVLLDWELPGQRAAALFFASHGLQSRPKIIILSA
jgi:DNA-binding NarL/FixJ family response regulator